MKSILFGGIEYLLSTGLNTHTCMPCPENSASLWRRKYTQEAFNSVMKEQYVQNCRKTGEQDMMRWVELVIQLGSAPKAEERRCHRAGGAGRRFEQSMPSALHSTPANFWTPVTRLTASLTQVLVIPTGEVLCCSQEVCP